MEITPITEEFYFSFKIMTKALVNCTMKYRYLIGQEKMTNAEKEKLPQEYSTIGKYSMESLISVRH